MESLGFSLSSIEAKRSHRTEGTAHLCQGATAPALKLLHIAPQGQQGFSCCHNGGLEFLVGWRGGQLSTDCCRLSSARSRNCQAECDRVSSGGLHFLQLLVGSL